MTRAYNTLGRRILSILRPENGGPRKKNVLLGIDDPKRVGKALQRLIKAKQVIIVGDRKGARYALPR